MPGDLLTTKLFIPPLRPGYVPRPRLLARLHDSLTRPLTLIAAPAGFGKTTLVCEWLQHAQLTAGWVSLDEGDNDPARFIAYLSAALNVDAAPLRPDADPPAREAALTALINHLAANPSAPRLLILDDYHFITAAEVHQALTFLLEHCPPTLHLLLTTRTDPPLPLPRLRARGQLNEIRASDLRFTGEEAAALLTDLRLAPEQVAALEGRTEGWAAGLQLAALALTGRTDVDSFMRAFTGTHHFILDYLVDEVFQRQPAEVQEFLLKTSVLDRMTEGLCEAVTGQADDRAMLARLERDNIFIVPMDDQRRWYRYHHLFADLLRHRLNATAPDSIPDLQRRASRWHAAHDQTYEAIGYALAAKDYDLALQLAEQATPALPMRGEVDTLLSWLVALPQDVARVNPKLILLRAWAYLFRADVEAVEAHWREALRVLGHPDFDEAQWPANLAPGAQSLLGQVSALRSFVAVYRGQPSRAVALAERALSHLKADEAVERSALLAALGDARRDEDNFAAASRAYEESAQALDALNQRVGSFTVQMDLARLQITLGQLRRAESVCRAALAWGGGRYRPLFPVAQAHIELGMLLYERNDLTQAAALLTKGIAQCEAGGYLRYLVDGHLAQARVHWARGEATPAREAMERAVRLAHNSGVAHVIALAQMRRARLALAMGDLSTAKVWAQNVGLSMTDPAHFLREADTLTLARIHIAQSQSLTQAVRLLRELLAAAERGARWGSVIEILTALALAQRAAGQVPEAENALARALALAEPEGYARVFVDEGAPLAEVLRALTQHSAPSNYAQRLLSLFPAEPNAPRALDALTEREVEILRLVAAGLPNQEIANQLVVSLSTVKTHIAHVYSKLGAGNRTQAVVRARAMNLL